MVEEGLDLDILVLELLDFGQSSLIDAWALDRLELLGYLPGSRFAAMQLIDLENEAGVHSSKRDEGPQAEAMLAEALKGLEDSR